MANTPRFVEFLESHRPALTAGEYEIDVSQGFLEDPASDDPAERVGGGKWKFTVAGPQFSLSPQEIAAVFPPAGSLGDHSDAFPHVVLHRSTLPWERSGDRTAPAPGKSQHWTEVATPWLALLVYDEDDLTKKEIRLPTVDHTALTVKELDVSDASYAPPEGAALDVPVAAVDVRTASLPTFIPTAMECRLLCHVRRNILLEIDWDEDRPPLVADLPIEVRFDIGLSDQATIQRTGEPNCWRLIDEPRARSFLLWQKGRRLQVTDEDDAEFAFVIGNRLPRQGKTTSVHLVSLEQRFAAGADQIAVSDKEYTRFVSLHQWRFSCESHEHTFKELLLNLNRPGATATGIPLHEKLTSLRLPRNSDGPTETRLAAGFTLLPHQFRDGSQSYSWYRGPLTPGLTNIDSLPLPAKSSDVLLAYDQRTGLFDTGYAAAWELGRLLCLANNRISQALYQWKREDRRKRRHTETVRLEQLSRLPVAQPAGLDQELPAVVTEWFASLRTLEPVPFRYLVPDERMLPVESIRFFEIDPYWVDCLVDGAFSIGRVLESDHDHDRILHLEQSDELRHANEPGSRVTGLLLRSAVVSGWPLMSVDASSMSSEKPHERLRFDRLAPDVLLCLFKGSPTKFEVHLPRETIHFGLNVADRGGARKREILMRLGVFLEDRRLRLKQKPPSKLDPTEFALHMVEGVPKVVFQRPVTR